MATPAGYGPDKKIVHAAQEMARKTGAVIEIMTDPRAAADGADAVYTDAWASMGQEHEAPEREKIFPPYQVNDKLMAAAAPQRVIHALPARASRPGSDGRGNGFRRSR